MRDTLNSLWTATRHIQESMWSFARAHARQREGFLHGTRGQTNLVGLFIGLMVAAIVAVNVFIPVVNDAISSSNVTGNTETILDLLSLFAALLLLVALAAPLMRRV